MTAIGGPSVVAGYPTTALSRLPSNKDLTVVLIPASLKVTRNIHRSVLLGDGKGHEIVKDVMVKRDMVKNYLKKDKSDKLLTHFKHQKETQRKPNDPAKKLVLKNTRL
jgi:ABC-type methionine transport system ATPase subunit